MSIDKFRYRIDNCDCNEQTKTRFVFIALVNIQEKYKDIMLLSFLFISFKKSNKKSLDIVSN